jgi:predicted DNA-binding protein
LTQIPISDTGVRMGRPSLKVKATVVRLSDDVRQRIEVLAGKNRMAEFIREAIERELKRREKANDQ